MDVLEQAGVISKLDEMSGGVNRLKKAYRWEGFARDTGRDAFDLGAYGYRKAKDAANPVASTVRGWFGGAQGGGKRGPSMWIAHVKQFAEQNNIPYKEALKAAGPSYRAIKNKM